MLSKSHLNHFRNINIYFYAPLKNFSEKKTPFKHKMDLILQKENQIEKSNLDENKFIQEKTLPLLRKTQIMRLPIYLTIPFLIWTSPLSSTYPIFLLFSNLYMLFLTCLEGSALFSLAHNSYNLVLNPKLSVEKQKEFVIQRKKVIRKRLFMMIFFFFSLIGSAVFAFNEEFYFSLAILLGTNIYLYGKLSYHITLFYADKISFTRRIKNTGMNMLLITGVSLIVSRKKKFINNNLVYTSTSM
jgi:hypothetical protein